MRKCLNGFNIRQQVPENIYVIRRIFVVKFIINSFFFVKKWIKNWEWLNEDNKYEVSWKKCSNGVNILKSHSDDNILGNSVSLSILMRNWLIMLLNNKNYTKITLPYCSITFS